MTRNRAVLTPSFHIVDDLPVCAAAFRRKGETFVLVSRNVAVEDRLRATELALAELADRDRPAARTRRAIVCPTTSAALLGRRVVTN
jgi:hypothetical protein